MKPLFRPRPQIGLEPSTLPRVKLKDISSPSFTSDRALPCHPRSISPNRAGNPLGSPIRPPLVYRKTRRPIIRELYLRQSTPCGTPLSTLPKERINAKQTFRLTLSASFCHEKLYPQKAPVKCQELALRSCVRPSEYILHRVGILSSKLKSYFKTISLNQTLLLDHSNSGALNSLSLIL